MAVAKKEDGAREGLSLVIGGLFVLGIVFATYSYFSRGPQLDTEVQEGTIVTEESEGKTVRDGEEGADGKLMGEDGEAVTGETGKVITGAEGEVPGYVGVGDAVFSAWAPNDYVSGDIVGGSYKVIWGDTLWEISEGAYGDNLEWVKIRDANSSEIGMLPNGEQALIFPDQVLTLP